MLATTPSLEVPKDHFALDLDRLVLPPKPDHGSIQDRSVPALHTALKGEKVLLLVTGGIAAYKTPGLVRMLRSYGATVDVRMTENAKEFIGQRSLEWAAEHGQVRADNALTGEVEHLAAYSMYLVAPATYNFINGMATGRADSPALTTMATALGRVAEGSAKMLVLPCMNGDMNNPILRESMQRLQRLGVSIVHPRVENGKLEYPGSEFITVAVARAISKSPLRDAHILLTAGPTPVPIDDVRRITNIFKGRLGLEIAKELTIRGANPTFLLGGSLGVPGYLKPLTRRYSNFEQYKDLVLKCGALDPTPQFAVLSSAVADYKPAEAFAGKIASKSPTLTLPPLVPTEKVVDLLHAQTPKLPIVSFKLLSRVTEEMLLAEARARLVKHSVLVVANRLEDCAGDQQVVHLVTKSSAIRVAGSKRAVAAAIVDAMERLSSEQE